MATVIFDVVKTKSIYGESPDGVWSAVLQVEFLDPKQTWSGYLCYNGEGELPDGITLESTVKGREHDIPWIEPEWFDYNICLPLDILMFRSFPTRVYPFLRLKMSKEVPVTDLNIFWEQNGIPQSTEIHLQ